MAQQSAQAPISTRRAPTQRISVAQTIKRLAHSWAARCFIAAPVKLETNARAARTVRRRLSSGVLRLSGHVAAAGKKARDRNILVQIFPSRPTGLISSCDRAVDQ